MSEALQIINIIVLIIAIGFALYSLFKIDRDRKKKIAKDDVEIKQWERGAEIAINDKEYMAFVNDITGLGKEYDPHKWYFKLPDSALKHLEACFEGDEKKVYLMKRAIELSIEHFAQEMEDDAACARIIEERVFNNPKPMVPFDREEYMRYRKQRKEQDGSKETFEEWKHRGDESSPQSEKT
ncbi:hypothetical protein [Sulfuricurvum sp.]|uniref:hypothetical protein n=1 Tax=Sulfuricurvum sp. TaxID=2025608 RepID=UPI0035648B24